VAASNLMMAWRYTGAWDELEGLGAELLNAQARDRPGAEYVHLGVAMLSALRGALATAREHLSGMSAWRSSEANEPRWTYAACEATIALAAGEPATALELLAGTMGEIIDREGASSQASRIGFPCALEAALELGQTRQATELLALLADRPPGHVPPFLRAQVDRGRGLLAVDAGELAVAHEHFTSAIAALSALGYPYWLARVRTDLGALLASEGRTEEARGVLEEAIAALEQLRAAPAVARASAVLARLPVAAG
jgi:tetratricopeptide (TPR) repeat protein